METGPSIQSRAEERKALGVGGVFRVLADTNLFMGGLIYVAINRSLWTDLQK